MGQQHDPLPGTLIPEHIGVARLGFQRDNGVARIFGEGVAAVGGTVVGPMQWIGTYLCVFMMVREIFSIIENIQAIYPILPKNFVKRMKDFNDSGEYISGKPIRFSDKDAQEEV